MNWHRQQREAPIDQAEIGELLAIIVMQNEVIMARLEERSPKLSPEDQKKINQIFDLATADRAKLDAATAKPAMTAPGGTPV